MSRAFPSQCAVSVAAAGDPGRLMNVTTPALDDARAAFPVWGGTAVVLASVPDRLDAACAAARAEIEAVDLACSRSRSDSQLARVNASAGRPVPVSALFAEAVEVALRAARLTDGAVDPTSAATLAAAGHDRWRSVEWDRRRRVIRIEPGSMLDFGMTAKALAVDRASYAAHLAADCGVLVSLGGDLAACGPAPEGGWRVGVGDGDGDGDDRETVAVSEGGLATFSTAVRRGTVAQSCWRAVSVAAITCVDAKIAATAAIARGQCATRWLTGLGLPARLTREDGSVLTLAGWPAAPDRHS